MTHTNNPTDTNQASEYELRNAIDEALHINWAFKKSKPTRIIIDGSATKGAYHTSYDLFTDNILELIRTEKLKLLAEVRERVQVNQKGQFEEDSTGNVCWYLDDLVEALKEMEAEL